MFANYSSQYMFNDMLYNVSCNSPYKCNVYYNEYTPLIVTIQVFNAFAHVHTPCKTLVYIVAYTF